MEGLAGGDEVDAAIAQARRLRPPVDAVEAAAGPELGLGHRRHRAIGLDAVHHVPVLDEQAREEARAGPDVRDDVRGTQAEVGAQRLAHRRRVAGTPADIVLDAIAEARRGIGGVGSRHPE